MFCVQTAAILGNRDPSLGYQPIPVMSDSDILFMTQLSNDISRSVGGISAVRYHGLRTKKRKIRSNGIGARSSKKEEKSSPHVGTSKRTQVCWRPRCDVKILENLLYELVLMAVIRKENGR